MNLTSFYRNQLHSYDFLLSFKSTDIPDWQQSAFIFYISWQKQIGSLYYLAGSDRSVPLRHQDRSGTFLPMERGLVYYTSLRIFEAKFYGRLRVLPTVLRASNFSVLTLFKLAILWVYYHDYTVAFGFNLFCFGIIWASHFNLYYTSVLCFGTMDP